MCEEIMNWAFGKLDKNQVANALSILRILEN
jgi:hypothetical protein